MGHFGCRSAAHTLTFPMGAFPPMKLIASITMACLLATGFAPAAVDLSFEPSDSNLLQYPSFSGSNRGISGGTATATNRPWYADSNDTLNPADGTAGFGSYRTTFQFTTSTNDISQAFLRITDANDRHTLSAPEPEGGIGIYVKYAGGAGPIRLALAIREDPVSTGGNEIYENTTWVTLQGSNDWQYFWWPFATGMDADPTTSWSVGNALGDGVYDGAAGEGTKFEAILLAPIAGATRAGAPINILFDDIHTGARHNPVAPPNIADSDHDGLLDVYETGTGTDPQDRDTDSDGFEDGVEVRLGTDPLSATSPADLTDSDGDGLPDSNDPNSASADSDGDGYQDFAEVAQGSDPNSGNSRPGIGDADFNGVVDNADAALIMNTYLGWAPASPRVRERMDVNRDGTVDPVDAIIIINWFLRNMPYLPY